MAGVPDWHGIVRHRNIAEAELAALEAVDGQAESLHTAELAGVEADDKPPQPGEEASWLERQLGKLESLRDQAADKLRELGQSARGGVRRVAKGARQAARRGLKAAKAVLPSGDSVTEKLVKGFKALIASLAVYAGGGIMLNLAILYGVYLIASDERTQSAARSYYSRR